MLRRLYRDVDGYELSRNDEARVAATRASATYGEIMPSATAALIEHLDLGRRDTFYDLGSGTGRVVLHVALARPVAASIGIELARSRHRIANNKLAELRGQCRLRATHCGFRCTDLMRAKIGDATVVYTCSTAFSTTFMNTLAARLARLRPGLRWVTTQDVDENPWFRLDSSLRLDMSWRRRTKVHIYRLAARG